MEENFNKKTLIIVGLIVLAVLLGFALKNKSVNPDNPSAEGEVSDSEAENPLGDFVDTRDLSSLSANQKSVLEVPYNGTDAEKKAHFDLAVSLAKDSNIVDVAGCLGSPLVSRVKKGSSIVLKNTDNVDHEIIFNESVKYTVGASSQQTIQGPFEKGSGLYGFGCDNNPGVAGLFLVGE